MMKLRTKKTKFLNYVFIPITMMYIVEQRGFDICTII